MKLLSVVDLQRVVSRRIDTGVQACADLDTWYENHLTSAILTELRRTPRIEFVTHDQLPAVVQFLDFKQSGEHEYKRGDICLIVDILWGTGSKERRVQGVVYLEAKGRNRHTGRFDAFDEDQQLRIFSYASRFDMLYYSFSELAYNRDTAPHVPERLVNLASTIPGEFIWSGHGSGMSRFGTPLADKLAFRYFQGFDLEYEPSTVLQAILGCKNMFVGRIVVASGRERERVEERISELPEIELPSHYHEIAREAERRMKHEHDEGLSIEHDLDDDEITRGPERGDGGRPR